MDWVVKSKTYKTTKDHDNRSFQEGVLRTRQGGATTNKSRFIITTTSPKIGHVCWVHIQFLHKLVIFFAFSSDGS
jgi:hypothetical protein